jgi:hypothetical protein
MTSIVTNSVLDNAATSESTGTVGEPSFASSGRRMMITGNWYASRSTDRGQNWTFIDPFTEFPDAAGGFCCDQMVHYSRSRRIWIWLLQYLEVGGENVFRIATSRSGAPGTWVFWEIPSSIDPAFANTWFDYPDVSESDDNLLVSFNMFNQAGRWQRAVVFRFPLDDIKDRGSLSLRKFVTTEFGSLRFVQGVGDSMWFASHAADNRSLRLFEWPDGDNSPSAFSIDIRPWNGGPYSSTGPGGGEWLARTDGRITAGWRARGVLGFAWTASPEPGRPNPFIRVSRIAEDSLALINEPDLWSSSGAFAYPAISPNRRGDVGVSAFFGGPLHPTHVVGNFNDVTGQWSAAGVAASTHAPNEGKWGDYVSCRPDPQRRTFWIGAGYTLRGGTNRRNVEPEVVTFRP